MQIVPVTAAATPALPVSGPAAAAASTGPGAALGRSGAAALDNAAAQVGLDRSALLGNLTGQDRQVLAAVAAQAEDAGAVAAAVATERYLGRLLTELTVDHAQNLYDRYARTPYPIEPAHLAGIITFLEARRSARAAVDPAPAPPAARRVDRVL